MTEVLPNFKNNFCFYNVWLIEVQKNVTIKKDKKILVNLLPKKKVIILGLYEYYNYWKKVYKYYLKTK